jgi:hypothetical protein
VIREEKFTLSKRPYAVNLTSLRVKTIEPGEGHPNRWHRVTIDAVWFRRRRGETVACIGQLWDGMRDPAPVDVHDALRRMDDGRYGGDCRGRWDGRGYWGAEEPAVVERHLALLRPMLAAYPAAPAGFDGWWRYETRQELRALAARSGAGR